MKTKTLLGVLGILLPMLTANAQREYAQKYLVPYAQVPEIRMPQVLNWKDSIMHLSDLRGKLVIIDFWNIHCSGCIARFREVDSLQRAYGDKVQFLMATQNPKEEVRHFLAGWEARNGVHLSMPFVTGDTALRACFPYVYQPVYTWISPHGKLMGNITRVFLNRATLDVVLSEIWRIGY